MNTTVLTSQTRLDNPLVSNILCSSPSVQKTRLRNSNKKWRHLYSYLLFYLSPIFHRIFLCNQTAQKGVPYLRGKIHLVLVYLSPIWITLLYKSCSDILSSISVTISVICCLLNFTSSALLHNGIWTNKTFIFFTKLDYIGIFLMISGSCSPIPLLLFSKILCIIFIIVQWGLTSIGIISIVCGDYTKRNHSVRASVYICMGLINALFMKYLAELLHTYELFCLITMASFYIIGGVFYARKSPNLWPGVLGYHELFHGCCFISAICTFLLNMSVLHRHSVKL